MNQQDILRALDECESVIKKHLPLLTPMRAMPTASNFNDLVGARHALWMIGEARVFVADSRIEKAFRWLGFVQGVLWSFGFVTIEEAKNANRPRPLTSTA